MSKSHDQQLVEGDMVCSTRIKRNSMYPGKAFILLWRVLNETIEKIKALGIEDSQVFVVQVNEALEIETPPHVKQEIEGTWSK